MTLPSAPRDPGRSRRKPRHFGYEGCELGRQWSAFKAGAALWLHVHGSMRSKPCLREITRGEVGCEYCEKGLEAQVKGYVPVYREMDYKPCCVVVKEEIRDVVDDIPLHARLTVGRGRAATDPIYITRALRSDNPFVPLNAEQQAAVDVTESVLRLLKNPLLRSWYEHTHGLRDKPTSVPPAVEEGKYFAEHLDNLSNGKHSKLDTYAGALLGDAVGDVLRQRGLTDPPADPKPPGKNGKHKPR
jgi:hypothetical protein